MLWGAGVGALIGRTRWETVVLAPRSSRAAPATRSPLDVGVRIGFHAARGDRPAPDDAGAGGHQSQWSGR